MTSHAELLENLLLRSRRLYAREQDTGWRTLLAIKLNVVLDRVSFTLQYETDPKAVEFASAALSIVERVAEFERIDTIA